MGASVSIVRGAERVSPFQRRARWLSITERELFSAFRGGIAPVNAKYRIRKWFVLNTILAFSEMYHVEYQYDTNYVSRGK